MIFSEAEDVWVNQLGNLRNTVRQHLIAAQLAEHLNDVTDVLDVGCGQGTQALRLAARALAVTGVDLSEGLLSRMRASAHAQGLSVEAICSDVAGLDHAVQGRRLGLLHG